MNKAEAIARNSKSNDFKKLNPHLFGQTSEGDQEMVRTATAREKRLRQDSKPPNKTEIEFETMLREFKPDAQIYRQAITFRLANGVKYSPDLIIFEPFSNLITAYEVKGFMRDDAAVKIKVAASEYPMICWKLVWKKRGEWQNQIVIP